MDDPAASDALDYIAIRRLQDAYGDVVTRQAWDGLVSMFEPECPVRFDLGGGVVIDKTGPIELGAFIAESVARFSFFAFTPLNASVEVIRAERRATGRVYVCELFEDRVRQQWTTLYGLYSDSYAKDADGVWRFATRSYAALARTVAEGVSTTFGIPGLLVGDRSGPSSNARAS